MKKEKRINTQISSKNISGVPETSFDVVNKYGTYEIQPTADTDNDYPQIAQGLPRKNRNDKENNEPKSR